MSRALLLAVLAAAASTARALDPAAAVTAAPAPRAWSAGPPPALARVPARVAGPAAVEVRLANGLRVVVLERRRRPVVVARLLLPRGAVTDSERDLGATWLAVHLATDFRERGDQGEDLAGERSIRREVADLGGALAVAVEPDYVSLEVSGYALDLRKYLRVLAGIVTSPRHGEASFAARRDALLDAVEDVEASDPEALERVIAQAAFGAGHPYARSIIGTRASLGALGLEDVTAQQEKVLAPSGATLLVAGDVRAAEVLAEARAAFSRWAREAPPPVAVRPAAAPRGPFDVALLRRRPAATLVACATRPLGDVRASDGALDVLAAALGAGTRSRLAVALREEGGHTYAAQARIVRRRAARALVACAALDATRAEEGLAAFRGALEVFRDAGPTDGELARARATCLADVDGADEDLGQEAAAWTEAIALGRGAPAPPEARREIASATAAEVRRIAATALRPDGIRWILSGEPAAAERAVRATRLGRLGAPPVAR